MKKFFYLMSLCLCMFAGVAVMTSCGDDDDIDDIDPDNIEIEAGIKDNGKTMSLTIDYAGVYKSVQTATFESADDKAKVVKFIEQMVYSSSKYADAAWESMSASDHEGWKRDGKTFTYDATDDFKEFTKAEIRSIFEAELEAAKNYNNGGR